MSFENLKPQKGDILIGHPNSFPNTTFRKALKNPNWYKKVIYQPYNEDPLQLSYLNRIIPDCDQFIALCGKYWFRKIKHSLFSEWRSIMDHIDVGIHRKLFPYVKKKFNKPGNRKFLYIGNDYSYNNFAKNTDYLQKISKFFKPKMFGSIGNKNFENFENYGWLNLLEKKNLNLIKNYDFLIHTSKNDANPSTVLEAICWGLIPVVTKETGYDDKNIINIPLNNIKKTCEIIDFYQFEKEQKLLQIQKENYKLLITKYSWEIFRKKFRKLILKPKQKNIKISKKKIKIFLRFEKKSPNYYLNFYTIFNLIKFNISFLIKKFFNEKI